MLSIFLCTYCHLYIFFGKMSIQVLCLSVNWLVFLFLSCSSLYILGIKPLSDIRFANIFSHSIDSVFPFWILSSNTKSYKFDEVQCSFSFAVCAFGVVTKNSLPNPRSWRFTPLFSGLIVFRSYPNWWASVGWVSSCEPKGRWFDSQSGHVAWLQGSLQCFSSFLSPSLPLSLKINKVFKK